MERGPGHGREDGGIMRTDKILEKSNEASQQPRMTNKSDQSNEPKGKGVNLNLLKEFIWKFFY
jgi:hypothetical protein